MAKKANPATKNRHFFSVEVKVDLLTFLEPPRLAIFSGSVAGPEQEIHCDPSI